MSQVTSNINSKVRRNMAIIVSAMIFLPSFNFYLNNILRSLGYDSVGVLLYLILLMMEFYGLLLASRYHLIGMRAKTLAMIVGLMALLSFIIYREELGARLVRSDFHLYYSELLFLVFFGLPALMLSSANHSWNLVLSYSTKAAPVIVIMALFAWWRVGFSTWGDESINYMTLSYHVLTAGCICIAQSVKGFRPLYWVASVAFLFIIVAAGCRGAILCTIFFVVMIIFRQATLEKNKAVVRFWRIVGIALLLLAPLTFSSLFNDIGVFFNKIGITSRTIEMVSNDSFFESTARESIRKAIWMGLEDNPFGYGLYGDRYICTQHYKNGAEYAHNFFIELMADFGVILGPVLFATIIIAFIRSYKKNKTTDIGVMLLLLIPDGFIKLFFSSSFLLDSAFFILIGFIIAITPEMKHEIKS